MMYAVVEPSKFSQKMWDQYRDHFPINAFAFNIHPFS